MKKNFKIWIGFLLIFLFGVAAGISGTTYFVRNHIKGFMEGGPPAVNQKIIYRIIHDIDLNQSQRNKIDEIMLESRPDVIEISREFKTSITEITDRQIGRIREVLTPEQKEILDKRLTEFKEHLKNRFSGRDKGKWERRGGMEDHRPPSPTPR